MSQRDRDILLEVIGVLDAVTRYCPAEMRHTFHPVIDAVEFITQALERDEVWFSRFRIVTRRWTLLAEFFESICCTSRAEFFVEEARGIVRHQGLLETCERLRDEIAGMTGIGRPIAGQDRR